MKIKIIYGLHLAIIAYLLQRINSAPNFKYCTSLIPTLSRQIGANKIEIDYTEIQNHSLHSIKCCIAPLVRTNAAVVKKVDISEKCHTIRRNHYEITINEYDLIQVDCLAKSSSFGALLDQNFFHLTQKWAVRQTPTRYNRSHVNVLVIGIDKVTLKTFQQKAPRMQQVIKAFKPISLKSYTTNEPQVRGGLVEVSGVQLKDSSRYPLLWQYFKAHGYITAIGDDMNDLQLLDNHPRLAQQQPDFNYRLFDFYESRVKVSRNDDQLANVCIRNSYRFLPLLRNIFTFVATFKHRPFFGYFLSASLTRQPNELHYEELDVSLVRLFSFLFEHGIFSNTLVVLTTYHGFEPYVLTKGNSFCYLFVPTQWQHHKAMLRANENVLTTPFDLFATLANVLENDSVPIQNSYGISLLNRIPRRSCDKAGINQCWIHLTD